MRMLMKSGAALALLAMAATAVPADAQWGGRGHRRGDRVDGGSLVIGALLAGGLIAVLSSANKRQSAPPPPAPDYNDSYAAPIETQPMRSVSQATSDQDAAVDACVAAAEQEGRRFARVAKIDTVDAVDPKDDGWYVRGTLGLREDYRAANAQRKSFRCIIGDGRVEDVTFDGDRVAIN